MSISSISWVNFYVDGNWIASISAIQCWLGFDRRLEWAALDLGQRIQQQQYVGRDRSEHHKRSKWIVAHPNSDVNSDGNAFCADTNAYSNSNSNSDSSAYYSRANSDTYAGRQREY